MRNYVSILLVLALTSFAVQARPVDQEIARQLGQSFVTSRFELNRQSSDLNLVHTAFSERGEACYYIFNVGNTGFVIMAADDHYRPIIGYSDERILDVNDMAPALVDYLEAVRQGVMEAAQASSAPARVAADWAMLEKCGRLVSLHGGREDEYLVQTTWNQNYPYNYFCPEDEDGPGGHCYAGCVATAAAQLMKYWNHPLVGQGSYSYIPEDHPEYGPLSVDFGAATYDWNNMPNSITEDSPMAQIEAVAKLIYHVGVSVDMNYRPTSSAAYTNKLCEVMPAYFNYTDMMSDLYRENYTHDEYMQLIINSVDMNWPMVHRGGGHAYVLDGYNDNDMVHFNWGWSGSGDGWFDVDDHDYTEGESVIYNYVPAEIYAATPDMPTNLTVDPSVDNLLSATISWTNPSLTMTGQPLNVVDQIVVERNGQIVYVEDNVTPGAEMSIVDESVPYFDAFDYAVYAVTEGQHGAMARVGNVYIGPTCEWRIIAQSTNFHGWNGGYVSLYNTTTGKELQRFTLTNSVPVSLYINVPVGRGHFNWTAPTNYVSNMSLVIKDSGNHTVFTYQGSSSGMAEGSIHEFNNGCDNENPMQAPYGLRAEMEEDDAILVWESDSDPLYGFIIYRDERFYTMVPDGTSRTFTDYSIDMGHCYLVTALDANGESSSSNEICVSADDCMGASNLDFEYVGQYNRVKLSWDRPEISDGLSGYYLYRRLGDEGDYVRIKLLGASATSYTDNTTTVEGVYYYRLYAYYRDIDCTSAPATAKDNPNQFYLSVYYSLDGITEQGDITVNVFPNPADQSLKVEAEGMTQVAVYNMFGQQVYESLCDSNMLNVNVSGWSEGAYLMKVQTLEGVFSRRVSIVH